MARLNSAQLDLINSPKDMHELAKWVITNRSPGAAVQKLLAYAGIDHHPKPHESMIQYVLACIESAGASSLYDHPPFQSTELHKLLDEYLAYQAQP